MSTSNPQPGGDESWQSGVRHSSPYIGLGFQLAGTMLFYILAGYLLDRWLGTGPRFLLVGSVIGMVAFFFQIFRLTKRLSEQSDPKSGSGTQDS